MDRRIFNRGVKGHKGGSGRPPLPPEMRRTRPAHGIRAHPEEWELISRFAALVKKDYWRCKEMLQYLEQEIP